MYTEYMIKKVSNKSATNIRLISLCDACLEAESKETSRRLKKF